MAKYSIVTTPANADTILLSSLSEIKKYDNSGDFCEDFFQIETMSDLIFYKDKLNNFENLLKVNGFEINENDILFNGISVKLIADEKRRNEIKTEAKLLAEQISKQLKG